MRAVNSGLRPSFKSQLMVGVAGLAAVATTAAYADETPPPADAPKWKPFLELGAGGDNDSGIGSVNFFAPLKQDVDSLLFARVGVQTRFRDDNLESLNIGFRKKNGAGDWIFGGFVGFDYKQSTLNNNYTQFNAGIEAMNDVLDFHLNGYLPDKKVDAIPGSFALIIRGTYIGINQQQETAFNGFDGEVGFKVIHGGDLDLRLFAGGFSFQVDSKTKFPTKDMSGPRGGVELDLYDLDFLGPQSRFSASGEIRHDDLRGTTEFIGASLRIPLGDRSGGGAQTLDELDRRMVDNLRKHDGIVTSAQFNKSEPVIIYGHGITSQPTNTLIYVDNTAGAGDFADPTTLPDATTRPGPNQFIVLTDKDGGTVHTGGATLASGETLVEGGHTFDVRGVSSGAVFSHLFGPGVGPISLNNPGGTVLNLGSNTSIYGFNIVGPFTNGIYGHNVDNVVIDHISIDGGGAGTNGIKLVQDTGGSSHVGIYDSSVTGVTNNAIAAYANSAGAGDVTTDIYIDNSSLNGGNHAFYQDSNASGGSDIDAYAHIHNSTLTSGGTNVGQNGSASGGSTVVETVFIDPTTLTGGYYGVLVNGTADGGTLTQNVIIQDVTISGTKYSGVGVYGYSHNGGTLTQNVTMDNVSITGSYTPINITGDADSGGTTNQNVTMTDVTVAGGGYDGGENIFIGAFAGPTGTVMQDVMMYDVSSTGSAGLGLDLVGFTTGGTVNQSLYVGDSYIGGNHDGGIDISGFAGSGYLGGEGGGTFEGLLAQYVTIADTTITHNGVFSGGEGGSFYYGPPLTASVSASDGSAARQDVSIFNSSLDDNGGGVAFYADASTLASTSQNVLLDEVSITGIGGEGNAASFYASASTGGFTTQTIGIYGSDLSGAPGSAVLVNGYASAGGDVEQTLTAYFNDFSHAGGSNVVLYETATGYQYPTGAEGYAYYSHATQTALIAYTDMSHAGVDGIALYSQALNYGEAQQTTVLYFDDLSHNARDGVHVRAYATPGSSDYLDVYAYFSDLSHNARDGFNAYSRDINNYYNFGNYLIQHLNVVGSDLSYNGRSGFVDLAQAYGGYSFNDQYVVLANSDLSHEGLDGAAFLVTQAFGGYLSFGAAIQNVTISDSTLDNNGRDGLYATATSVDTQGRAEQHFTALYSSFSNNGRDGVYLSNFAGYGDYRNELPCGVVQGLYGGCAFVRQTFIGFGVDATENGRNGITILNTAVDYAAIYNRSGRPTYPTLYLYNSNISGNTGDGLHLENNIQGYSYGLQYIIAVDSHFDNNGGFGISATNTVGTGSYLIQNLVVFGSGGEGGSSVDGNALGGISINTEASYAALTLNLVGVYNSSVSGNGGDGISMVQHSVATYGAGQYLTMLGNAIVGNAGYGAYALNYSQGDFLAIQGVTSGGNFVGFNGAAGTLAFAADTAFAGEGGTYYSFLAQQSLTSQYDVFVDNAKGQLGQAANFSGFLGYQYTTIDHDYFTGGGSGGLGAPYGDGIYVAFRTSNYFAYAGRSITNNTLVNVGTDGIGVVDYVVNYGALVDSTAINRNNVTGSGQHGIYVSSYVGAGAVSVQYLDVSRNTAEGNQFGVAISGSTNYGQLFQYVTADYLHANSNNKTGLSLGAYAVGYGAVAYQMVDISNGKFVSNGGTGVEINGGGLYYGTSQQAISLTDTTVSHNKTGISASTASAYLGAANLSLVLTNTKVNGNTLDGLDMAGAAALGGFTSQYLYVSVGGEGGSASFVGNGADGINVVGGALYGGDVEQNIGLIGVTVKSNGHNGLTTATGAVGYALGSGGYYYYSHVTQNLIASGTFQDNGGDGINMTNAAGYFGQVNHFAYIYNANISKNGRNGVSELSGAISPDIPYPILTQVYSNVYLYGDTIAKNGRDGIDIESLAYHPSYLIQTVVVSGSHVDQNGRNGFEDYAAAIGYFSLNQQTITFNGSTFDKNAKAGAAFSVYEYYGPYSFGAAIQNVTMNGTDLSKNGQDGIYASAIAKGLQGRAEQNFTLNGATVDKNHRDGMHLYRYAGGGSYQNGLDCTEVQGLYGGCAFVRQRVIINGSDISKNGRDGINIDTVVNNYGAVYTQSGRPQVSTLRIVGSTVSGNGRDGVNLTNSVTDNSYLWQYAYLKDSSINGNTRDGLKSNSYVGGASEMLQRVTVYSYASPMSLSNNGRSGLEVTTSAGSGSLALSNLFLFGGTFNNNYLAGVSLVNKADGTAFSIGNLYANFAAYPNTFKGNGIGINLKSDGTGAYQYAYIGYNTFKTNGVGIMGRSVNGGFQYIDLHYGNHMASNNVVKYNFHVDGTSTQIINY